jgi:hypothetical protein
MDTSKHFYCCYLTPGIVKQRPPDFIGRYTTEPISPISKLIFRIGI